MSLMHDEIHQQPEVLRQLLGQEAEPVRRIAEALRSRDIGYVVIAARGSSDNAARYGKYLFGSQLGLQVALATPSLFTLYRRPPSLSNALVIGVSQSGQSRDIVSVLAEARRQGAPTLAITNQPQSPIAAHADHLIQLHAGDEKAVAATKTYTAELGALALLAAAMLGYDARWRELNEVPAQVGETLTLDDQVQAVAAGYTDYDHCVVLGRGYNYCTAFEIALKLKETCYLAAEAYSPADFLHGPVALVGPGYPAIVIAPSGATVENLIQFSSELRDKGTSLLVVSNEEAALKLADDPLRLPAGPSEWLSPIVAVVPGQLLAFHLAIARGLDPDQPRGLKKVTITR